MTTETMTLGAVFGASILGSLHCVAMCGPLISLSAGRHSVRLAMVHSLGRLATYVTLGVLAGLVGRAVDLAGDLAVVQRVATLVAGAAILSWGLWQLAVVFGKRGATPRFSGNTFTSGLVGIRSRARLPVTRAALAGMLTGLLPCGWLWSFAIVAAGTGSALGGGLLMLVFWLGTVPAMLGMLTVGGAALGWLRARIPALTAVTLIVLGLGTLALRWRDAGESQVTHPHCDCGGP